MARISKFRCLFCRYTSSPPHSRLATAPTRPPRAVRPRGPAAFFVALKVGRRRGEAESRIRLRQRSCFSWPGGARSLARLARTLRRCRWTVAGKAGRPVAHKGQLN